MTYTQQCTRSIRLNAHTSRMPALKSMDYRISAKFREYAVFDEISEIKVTQGFPKSWNSLVISEIADSSTNRKNPQFRGIPKM